MTLCEAPVVELRAEAVDELVRFEDGGALFGEVVSEQLVEEDLVSQLTALLGVLDSRMQVV